MKNRFLAIVVLLAGLFCMPAFSQTDTDEELLGLPGDNLDLYAVLDLFQKSKTIEDFEKSLNAEETGINNLDLNLDEKIDFIKVKTEQKDKDFTFILQVDIAENETQDVAVILVSKDKDDKVTMQIVGDKDLYGKNYVIEPKPPTPPVTANPAYTGDDPVIVNVAPITTVVVVESAPIVQYVYSPVYVPYYPPYYYGYYPPYFRATFVVSVGVYRHNNYYHHAPYHGGYGNNTVVIRNTNNYNNYNNSRNSSRTVNRNNASGNYNGNRSTGSGNRQSTGSASKPSQGNVNKPSTGNVNRPSTGNVNKPSATPSTRTSASRASSASQRQPSSSSYNGGGGGRSGSYSGGGGGRGGGGRR